MNKNPETFDVEERLKMYPKDSLPVWWKDYLIMYHNYLYSPVSDTTPYNPQRVNEHTQQRGLQP